MPEHEARIAALITRWRNGAASSDGEWEQCDQAELLRCADELEALLIAGEDVPLQGEPAASWQPIETAPTDGTPVIVHDEGATFIAWFSVEDDAWIDNGPVLPPPSHWMPLPPDPAGEASPSRPMAAGWTPTAANVNALPEPIRRYIHQLETTCDPSGDTQERVIAQDICRTQAIQLEQAEQQITTLTAERDQLQADLYGKPPYRPGAYAQIELEIKVRDEYLTRAEAAEARASALEAGFRKLKTLVDLRFMNEETQNIISTATQALLSPPPPSQETT